MMNFNLANYYDRKVRLFSHLLFWLFYWLYHSLLYGSYEQQYTAQFIQEGWYLPVKMAATYGTLYILLPRYFLQREYVKFVLILGVFLFFAAVFQRFLDYTIVSEVLYPDIREKAFFSAAPVFKIILGIYPVVMLAAFIKLAKHWYERDIVTRKLEKEKLEAELKFLKAQIHPHFLFNTLNNLYALTLKGSEKAAEVVLKLSGLLSYMLYEGNKRQVGLNEELEVIGIYISLERIRYGARLNISYDVEGDTEGKMIPPMLIIPFIENTFKHGISGQPEEAWIRIKIEVEENNFFMEVENSKSENRSESEEVNGFKDGIGLKNVKRRLELLYGDRHELRILDEPDSFRVVLELELNTILRPEEI